MFGRGFGNVSADHCCGFAFEVAAVLGGGCNACEARERAARVHRGLRDCGGACGGVGGGAAAETRVGGGAGDRCQCS